MALRLRKRGGLKTELLNRDFLMFIHTVFKFSCSCRILWRILRSFESAIAIARGKAKRNPWLYVEIDPSPERAGETSFALSGLASIWHLPRGFASLHPWLFSVALSALSRSDYRPIFSPRRPP